MPLKSCVGQAGSLTVSVTGLEALRVAQNFARADELRVDVGALSLSPALRRDADTSEVWVEVDMLGLASTADLRTRHLPKGAARLDFRFSHTVGTT